MLRSFSSALSRRESDESSSACTAPSLSGYFSALKPPNNVQEVWSILSEDCS